jgi:broad specificity phosphatase PhoE
MVGKRHLVLVRHSLPSIRADAPAVDWPLSPEGAERARLFARSLAPTTSSVYTSREPKAVETAAILAESWNAESRQVDGLQEHARSEVRLLTRDRFEAKIRDLFDRPADLVFGSETAEAARRRFTFAVLRLISSSQGDVVVVTHGTVMSLFVAAATGVDAFGFWKRLEMPCAALLTLPELGLDAMILPSQRALLDGK